MINLLPPEEKEAILKERKKKMMIIIWFLLFFFLISLSLILYSLKFYVKGQADYYQIILEGKESALEQAGIKDFQSQAVKSNNVIRKMSDFYSKKYYFTDVSDKVSGALISGIYLNNLSIAASENSFKISIAGFSPTREILFNFKNSLEKSGFQNLFFPQTNWVKPENITFYVSFELPK